MDDKSIELFIKAAMKSGKVVLGRHSSLKAIKGSKVIIASSSLPSSELNGLQDACRSSDVPLVKYQGSSAKLGAAVGKPFPVTVLSVKSAGDADLRKFLAGGEGKEAQAEQKP